MSRRKTLLILGTIGAVLTAAIVIARVPTIKIDGAVMAEAPDPGQQAPIGGVLVRARADGVELAHTTSDFLGSFRLEFPRPVVPGEAITLSFEHRDYRPLDLDVTSEGQIYLARMLSTRPHVDEPHASGPTVVLSDLVVRYSISTQVETSIGSGARQFQVVNTGNVPCDREGACSPDGKWKASVATVSMDAGADNQFRNARLSCIAGPCPFTRVDGDAYTRGGQRIVATVRNWSDTATFVLESEVFRSQLTDVTENSHPIILGRGLNFTLPATAQGPSIQAEVDGTEVVFPLGPNAVLSWATCEIRTGSERNRTFRCDLKPGYAFKKDESP
jgi:hypothetical protein